MLMMTPHPDWETEYLKIIINLVALVPTDSEHSVIPQEPLGQTLSVMCQRAGSECLLVRRGACLADLKSQMRSHFGKNGKPSLWTRKATFLYMQWKPRKSWISAKQKEALERKEATPPSCHASAHHTSHKLHAPFHLECSGPTSWMISLTHSMMFFAGCCITCSPLLIWLMKSTSLENIPSGSITYQTTTADQHWKEMPAHLKWKFALYWPVWQLLVVGVEAKIRGHQALVDPS